MAEQAKPAAPVTPAFTFNEQVVKEHMHKVEEGVNKFAGKKNYNPFLWVKEKVQPLVDRFMKGERTKELQEAIVALPTTPPPITVEAKVEEPVANQVSGNPESDVKATVLKPIGLKL